MSASFELRKSKRDRNDPAAQPLTQPDEFDSDASIDLGSNISNRDELVAQPENVRKYLAKEEKASNLTPFSSSPFLLRVFRALRCLIPNSFFSFLILLFIVSVVLLLAVGGLYVYKYPTSDGESPPWYPTPKGGTLKSWQEAYKKASALVQEMTLPEKVNVTSGVGWSMEMCVGNTGAVPRLGFPALCLQDGPAGLRFADNATAWPAGVTTAATWNRKLFYERGRAQGLEARLKGINVMLGPTMGPLGRMPLGGRNFEGFSPDPVLSGVAAAEEIRGIQEEGVIATAKHFVGNEQEHFRQEWEYGTPHAISSNMDDRTLHELYAWPFAESIRVGVASVMCSYNQVNNSYACQNSWLMNKILKDELGFQGFIQSDWLAQRSGVASALSGLDMSMPGDGLKWTDGNPLWASELTKAVLNESIPIDRLDDMVTRIVAAWYQLGQDDKSKWPPAPPDGEGGPNFSSWTNEEIGLLHPGSDDKRVGVVNKYIKASAAGRDGKDSHMQLARQIAREGVVMVKNENGILPLSRDGSTKGEHKRKKYRVGVFGEDARNNPEGPNACPDRGCNRGTLASGWGSGAVEFPYLKDPLTALRHNFKNDSVHLVGFPENDPKFKRIPELLRDQDLCIVFANADSGEGFIWVDGIKGDRNDLSLQKGGVDLIKRVAAGCGAGDGSGNTIVVIHAVGPVDFEPWISDEGIKAVLLAHLPSQESGDALADVLFGDFDVSGRLPYTVGKSLQDYGKGGQVLYIPNGLTPQQNFSEGVFVDYRHFDEFGIEPRFEFGFGMSYTSWELTSLLIARLRSAEPLPDPRSSGIPPPSYPTDVPEASSALAPEDFGDWSVKKYIYPWIGSVLDVTPGPYPYPPGYEEKQDLSQAGGGEGGNPSLYDVFATVSATLTNTGSREGTCVVQMYITFPKVDGIDMPPKLLRGFQKLTVQGDRRRLPVKMDLRRKDLSYWDVDRQNWVMPSGTFTVRLGFSSRNLPLQGTL